MSAVFEPRVALNASTRKIYQPLPVRSSWSDRQRLRTIRILQAHCSKSPEVRVSYSQAEFEYVDGLRHRAYRGSGHECRSWLSYRRDDQAPPSRANIVAGFQSRGSVVAQTRLAITPVGDLGPKLPAVTMRSLEMRTASRRLLKPHSA